MICLQWLWASWDLNSRPSDCYSDALYQVQIPPGLGHNYVSLFYSLTTILQYRRVCTVRMYVYIYTTRKQNKNWNPSNIQFMQNTQTHKYIHIHKCIHTYIHTYIHINTYTYIHVHIHVHIHACTTFTKKHMLKNLSLSFERLRYG